MVSINLVNISKNFDNIKAVDKINLRIKDGEFLAFLGPSGCGKTTILRIIAGLELPTSGEIFFDERRVTEMAPAERNVAMVFQNYALYPHMTVFENIAFPLEIRKVPKKERIKLVKETAALVRIENLLDRKPKELSGGQSQRVAIARSLVRQPAVFLMDEPLSNLDANLRVYMRAELKKLHEEIGITTVYVTHDQIEAMTMADRIALMKEGNLQQVGNSEELYHHPETPWAAGFIGSPPMNLIDCILIQRDGKKFLDAGEFIIPLKKDLIDTVARNTKYTELTFGIRPENISIHEKYLPYSIEGWVHTLEPIGESIIVNVSIGTKLLKAKVSPNFTIAPRSKVFLAFSEDKVYIYERKETTQ